MKKFCLIFLVCISICFSGCAINSKEMQMELDALTQKNLELQEENERLIAEKNNLQAELDSGKLEIAKSQEGQDRVNTLENIANAEENEIVEIGIDETTIIEDYCEFTLKHAQFSKKVLPPNPSGYYSYYEVKENKNTYIDVRISIKSLLTISKNSEDFIRVTAKYDNKYEYTGFRTTEAKGGNDFDSFVLTAPLETRTVHTLIEVPEDVTNSDKSVDVYITAEGNTYHYKLR